MTMLVSVHFVDVFIMFVLQTQLKGLDCQSEIGFLSLFEYYKSCTVSLCACGVEYIFVLA